MSLSAPEMVRELVRLWNEGVREVPADYFDPEVELESPFSSVRGEPYRGLAGLEQWAREIDEHFAEWATEIDTLEESGETVLSVGVTRGRGRGSGIELDQPTALLVGFASDGRIARVRIFWDIAAAREAFAASQ